MYTDTGMYIRIHVNEQASIGVANDDISRVRLVLMTTGQNNLAPLLHVPFRRTFFGKRSFSTAAPSVWNSLPVSLQNCDTLTLFKSRLKAHLFSSVYAS